jgi:hypothetical protein
MRWLAHWLVDAILRLWFGGGPGVESHGWTPLLTHGYNNFWWNNFAATNLDSMDILAGGWLIWRRIWNMPPYMVEPPPDLAGSIYIYIFFFFRLLGPHWAFSHCHVVPMIGPRGIQSLAHVTFDVHPTMSPPRHLRVTHGCHVILPRSVDATCPVTWGCHVALFIGPHVGPKSPKMSDTWQPLVLPTSSC